MAGVLGFETKEMPDSESGALPLGYTPMTNGTFIILYENVPVCQPLFIKITKVSAFSFLSDHMQSVSVTAERTQIRRPAGSMRAPRTDARRHAHRQTASWHRSLAPMLVSDPTAGHQQQELQRHTLKQLGKQYHDAPSHAQIQDQGKL